MRDVLYFAIQKVPKEERRERCVNVWRKIAAMCDHGVTHPSNSASTGPSCCILSCRETEIMVSAAALLWLELPWLGKVNLDGYGRCKPPPG